MSLSFFGRSVDTAFLELDICKSPIHSAIPERRDIIREVRRFANHLAMAFPALEILNRATMSILQSDNFDASWGQAAESVSGTMPEPANEEARLRLWRRQEWHGWFRWRLCRKGFDWSKPLWMGLLVIGFTALALYGYWTGRLFVTAGGVVFWFTLVNLSGFTYFGLILPGPPLPIPGPFDAGQQVRAKIAIYPPGYDRRKLARIWARLNSATGEPHVLELPVETLPDDLHRLMKAQEFWRIQRADAPATDAVVETVSVTRAQIDEGALPLRVIAWRWDDQILETFGWKRNAAAQAAAGVHPA